MISETLIVYYSRTAWDDAIEAELKRRGLKQGDVSILALPEEWRQKGKPNDVADHGRKET